MKAEDLKEIMTLAQEKKFVIYLVKEELKGWKFFNMLRELGMDNSFYQADHSVLIRSLVGLDDDSWETDEFYNSVMEKHSEALEPDEHSLFRQAVLVITDFEKNRYQG